MRENVVAGHDLWSRAIRNAFALCRDCSLLRDCLNRGALPLHGLSSEQGARLLRRLAQEKACFLIADYALPERNLHFLTAWLRTLLENLVRTGHGAHYRAFMRTGALEGALAREGMYVLERRSLGLGLLIQVRCAGNSAGQC